MATPSSSAESVLVVEASSEERGRYGAWLEREGFPVLVCPGPTEPDYLCIGARGGTCPLASGATVVVLDMSLDSEAVVMGTPAEELLGMYVSTGHRVVVLGSRTGEEVPGRLVRLPRHPGREELVAAVRTLTAPRPPSPSWGPRPSPPWDLRP
jgi:hypothetical protein